MIFVDTSVWINYFTGKQSRQTDFLDSILMKEPVATGDLILTEVLNGLKNDANFHSASLLLRSLAYYDMIGKEIAIQSALNYRILRNHGLTVRKTIDVIIGTFCIHHHFQLLHEDKDFKPIETHLGLQVAI